MTGGPCVGSFLTCRINGRDRELRQITIRWLDQYHIWKIMTLGFGQCLCVAFEAHGADASNRGALVLHVPESVPLLTAVERHDKRDTTEALLRAALLEVDERLRG